MTIKTSLVVAGAAALLLAGCGGNKGTTAANGAAGNGTIVASGGGATVTKDASGATTVTSNQGSATISTGAPSGNLPGGLPAYANAQAGGGMEASAAGAGGIQGRVTTFTTADAPAQVLDFYANAANQAGMQTMARTNTGPSSALVLMKGSETITVSATAVGGTTQVQIASATR